MHSKTLAQEEYIAPSAPSAPAAQHSYRPDIDGLRAVAVLSVVMFHAFPSLLPGGFIGVDIFFVISGFLISGILVQGLRDGSFSFAQFYGRRIKRIFPVLTIVMLACAAFGWVALFPDEYKMLGKHIVGGSGFLSNFFLWNEVGYFDTTADTKPLLHLWSLAVEEQFYIVWPVLLWLTSRWRRAPLLLALLLGTASFCLNVGGVQHYPSATFYSPASRMWELLVGAAFAYVHLGGLSLVIGVRRSAGRDALFDFSGPRWRNGASVAGLALIGLGLALASPAKRFPGWWALLPTLGALLVLAAGPRAWCNRWLLSNRLAVWFGLISYPLYLWHWPLLSFAHIVEGGLLAREERVALLAAAVLLAWLSYRVIERPMRRPSHTRYKVAALVAAMTALAGVGATLYQREGLPLRASVVENAQQQKALILVEDVANAKACKQRYGFADIAQYCLLDDVDKAPTVALIGDSHAYHIVAGLTKYYRAQGGNLWYLGTRVPFFGLPGGTDPYQQATAQMMDLALNTPTVKTVIISTAAKVQMDSEDDRAGLRAFRETLRRFVDAGKTVIYVKDLPLLDFEPRTCIRRAGVASSQTRRDCWLARSAYDSNVARHLVALNSVLRDFPTVQLFDSAAQLCDQRRCYVMLNQQMLYRDTHHLSYDGDLYMGGRFALQQQQREAARRAGLPMPPPVQLAPQ